jgi:lycopene cyclase domain-containing protein
MPEKYYYLLINLGTILVPLIRSFEPRIRYVASFKSLFAAIALIGIPFIIWDAIFTANGVWGFNPRYLSGIEGFGLPLGEFLFFVTVPFSCVFIYRVLNYFVGPTRIDRMGKTLAQLTMFFSATMAAMNTDKAYTFWTFLFLALFMAIHLRINAHYLGRMFFAYAICLVPFFIVNGVLTGSWIPEEIVWYNDDENLGIRIGTIPMEDAFYGMLLIMGNITVYEELRSRYLEKQL